MPDIHHIELNLDSLEQLFNTMDPSPFHLKDLDHDAEEFILSWAQEFHRHEPVDLIIHLSATAAVHEAQHLAADAIHNYFAYRSRLNALEFSRLLKVGRMSLLVGLGFLGTCLLASKLLQNYAGTPLSGFFKEGLTIVGWVAMWKPLEIYLYEWWPLRRRGQIFTKLSKMPIHIQRQTRHKTLNS